MDKAIGLVLLIMIFREQLNRQEQKQLRQVIAQEMLRLQKVLQKKHQEIRFFILEAQICLPICMYGFMKELHHFFK